MLEANLSSIGRESWLHMPSADISAQNPLIGQHFRAEGWKEWQRRLWLCSQDQPRSRHSPARGRTWSGPAGWDWEHSLGAGPWSSPGRACSSSWSERWAGGWSWRCETPKQKKMLTARSRTPSQDTRQWSASWEVLISLQGKLGLVMVSCAKVIFPISQNVSRPQRPKWALGPWPKSQELWAWKL